MFSGVQEEYKQLGIYILAGKIKEQEIQQEISRLTKCRSRIRTSRRKFMT